MNELEIILRQHIDRHGPMPFVQFMDTALYHPTRGYYRQARIGRRGDFFTSVSVGCLFGQLLACQFAAWLQDLGPGQIVEAGAHDGQLACDLLTWLRDHRPEIFGRVRYQILEPLAERALEQRRKLNLFADKVDWFSSLEAVPGKGVQGIIFSNEWLDAFPVHRLGWDAQARKWYEWGVTSENQRFVFVRLPELSVQVQSLLPSLEWSAFAPAPRCDVNQAAPYPDAVERGLPLADVLPDGFTIEVSPRAVEWWRAAAAKLAAGKLLTIDYGFTAEQWLQPHRSRGTLRAYRRHHVSDDLLACPGEQDLTAHVNFTPLQSIGESAGLRTLGLWRQSQFLTHIAEQWWREAALPGWTPAMTRQFQTLTHPEHLGHLFRVLVQERDAD